MTDKLEHAPIIRAARLALLACGLCFGLLLLMGISGVASITLLYDDPIFNTTGTLEGTTLAIVRSLADVIGIIHTWGGYLGIVLAGWAGLQTVAFARKLKATDNAEWRAAARRLPILAMAGAVILIASLLLLIPSGVAAKAFLRSDDPRGTAAAPEVPGPRLPGQQTIEDAGDERFVDWHTSQLNYLMAIGAILLVFAASTTRRIALEAKKPADRQPGV